MLGAPDPNIGPVSYTGKLRPWLSVNDARHVGGAHHRSPANMAARASLWCRQLGDDVNGGRL
ncbi:hypothetical protein HaLaN_28580 [Haematococcus lacustris]|uniref:Uncharacterized protein n=1 Tax=Haematococcus lacustris TaxID=44745 RepID=A0A6A0AAU8_HAELA|nr:hypothetical protein HaLaN_28580 [Haematococcus lacustris]